MEKLKEIYENPRIDLILINSPDIITSSPNYGDEKPDLGNMDDWTNPQN